MGKVHMAMAKSGRTRDMTPKVLPTEKAKKPTGRAKRRKQIATRVWRRNQPDDLEEQYKELDKYSGGSSSRAAAKVSVTKAVQFGVPVEFDEADRPVFIFEEEPTIKIPREKLILMLRREDGALVSP